MDCVLGSGLSTNLKCYSTCAFVIVSEKLDLQVRNFYEIKLRTMKVL